MPISRKPGAKTSATQKAVNSVKSAPQKIVEHALNTAINTVEKAAQTDVMRTAKRAEKTAKKLEKVQKIARAAKTDAKRASNLSSRIDKMNQTSKTSNISKVTITDKIKEIITPQKEVSFYYDYRQLLVLTAIYALLAIFVYIISVYLVQKNMYESWWLYGFMVATQIFTLGALASVVYVTAMPQRLAFINKEGIKIDHNEMLAWNDIEVAEERYTTSIAHRRFIALHVTPENLVKYRLTFMQKLCQGNIFTPFSIPLYAMKAEDAVEIRNIIKRHAKYQDNCSK